MFGSLEAKAEDDNGKISLHEFCKDGGLADLILRKFKIKRSKLDLVSM